MHIALASDHAGFEALDMIRNFLEAEGHTCADYGPVQYEPDDDYPDFIIPAAQAVAEGVCERAIILGGSGQGEAMAANRVIGARAAVFYGPVTAKTAIDAEGHQSDDDYEIVRLSRQHNDANVLSLSSRFLTHEQMKQAISIWLATAFSGVERHQRRIQKLDTPRT